MLFQHNIFSFRIGMCALHVPTIYKYIHVEFTYLCKVTVSKQLHKQD